jgi:hypothetical protein
MQLLGINGFKRSGKNTASELAAAARPNVKCIGFADKLKVVGARALGMVGPDEKLIEIMDEFKERGRITVSSRGDWLPGEWKPDAIPVGSLSGRQYLQWLGTEGVRETFWDTFWIDLVLPQPVTTQWSDVADNANLERMYPGVDLLIFTDTRIINEAARIKALGGQIWKVYRPETGGSDGHPSEMELPASMIDFILDNSGDLAQLEAQVEAALDFTLPTEVTHA